MTVPSQSHLCPLPPLEDRNFGEHLIESARRRPDEPALTFPAHDVSWTYSELLDQSRAMSAGLQRLGVAPGTRVAIMLSNGPEYVLAWYGCIFAGAVDVAVHYGISGEMLVHEFSVAAVTVAICDTQGVEALRPVLDRLPELERMISVDGAAPGDANVTPFADVADCRPDASDRLLSPTDLASIRYTSGTSGPAKAVGLTMSHMTVFASHFNWLTELTENDRIYTAFPLHHSFASVLGVVSSIQVGSHCIVDGSFSASRYMENLRRHRATIGHILPPQIPMLEAQPTSAADTDHECRVMFTAFTNPGFEQRFNIRLIQNYAMTEGGTMAFVDPGETNRESSMGRVNPMFDMRIVDENDEEVPVGEEGEIVWRPRSPHIMMHEYVGDPMATVRAWRGLWFHTSDRGRIDSDGYLYFFGRTGEQIRRKGVNIAAFHIEEVARQIDGVVEAVAIAVPAEVGESEIKLCVEVGPGSQLTGKQVHEHCAAHLPREMVPRYIEMRDSLPRTPTFKVFRKGLLAEGDNGITDTTVDFDLPRTSHVP